MSEARRFNFKKKETVYLRTDALPPPQSSDAEKGILSCLLQNPQDLIADSIESIPEESFHHPVNRQLYKEMLSMFSEGRAIDIVTLSQRLIDNGELAKLGGPSFIAELLSFIPTPAHYPEYKSILRDKNILRLATETANATLGTIHGTQNVDEVAEVIENGLAKVALEIRNRNPRKSWAETVDDLSNHWTQRYLGNEKSAVPSPWPSWDEHLGGIRPGYHLILGLRKTGKSSLVGHKALHLSVIPKRDDRVKSIIFSYETPVDTYVMRLASNLSGVRGECLLTPETHRPNENETRKIARAFERIANAPIEIINATGMNIYQMEAAAKKFGAYYVGIDYLMLVGWLPDSNQKEGTEGRIRSNSNAIIAMSRNLNACVDVINHSVKSGDRIGESRWSDQPQSDCDLCVNVDEDGITIKESRNTKSGATLPVFFKGETYSFVEESLEDSVN